MRQKTRLQYYSNICLNVKDNFCFDVPEQLFFFFYIYYKQNCWSCGGVDESVTVWLLSVVSRQTGGALCGNVCTAVRSRLWDYIEPD